MAFAFAPRLYSPARFHQSSHGKVETIFGSDRRPGLDRVCAPGIAHCRNARRGTEFSGGEGLILLPERIQRGIDCWGARIRRQWQ